MDEEKRLISDFSHSELQTIGTTVQSIKICFHLFFNFFRIFCAQHQIRFLIVCNSFQPALYMVTEILEIIYLLFLSYVQLPIKLIFNYETNQNKAANL